MIARFVGTKLVRRLVALCMMVGVVSVSTLAIPAFVHAQSGDEAAALPKWTGSGEPLEAKPGGWDWIRTSSNEWVKGEIILMRDFDLEFDSDEFGVVKLSWEDVSEIFTEHVYTLVLEDMTTSHTGTVAMRGDKVYVNVGERIESFERSLLLAITPSAKRELNLWTARASAGISIRSGNTEETTLSGEVRLGREAKRARFGITYNGEYGSLNNEKNTNNHRGRTTLDYFLTRDVFLTPASFEVFSDEFQNISYRLTPSTGLGYYLLRRQKVEWQARLMGGYQHTRFDSAAAGDSKTSDNGAITFGTTLDADLNSRVDLILEYQLQVIVPDAGQTNHHAQTTLEVELTSFIDLDLRFIWDRIEDPETDSGGATPDTDDFRITAGLAIEY